MTPAIKLEFFYWFNFTFLTIIRDGFYILAHACCQNIPCITYCHYLPIIYFRFIKHNF